MFLQSIFYFFFLSKVQLLFSFFPLYFFLIVVFYQDKVDLNILHNTRTFPFPYDSFNNLTCSSIWFDLKKPSLLFFNITVSSFPTAFMIISPSRIVQNISAPNPLALASETNNMFGVNNIRRKSNFQFVFFH